MVVLHEANLHHLIADLTIRRGDWDAYLREVENNGGAEALEYAQRHVRTLRARAGLRDSHAAGGAGAIARGDRS